MITHALLRVEHNNRLAKSPSCRLNCSDLVSIACNNDKTINIGLRGIHHHFNGQVHIGALFLKPHYAHKTITRHVALLAGLLVDRHQYFVLLEETIYHLDISKREDRLKVDVLAFNSGFVVGICQRTCSEVLDRDNFMFIRQQLSSEHRQVEPLIRRSLKKAVIEVVTVDIDYGFLLHRL